MICLLVMTQDKSQRYAMQNGRVLETNIEELAAFLGVTFLMGINKLPSLKLYWATDEGLGNTLIQNTMTRQRYLDILENIHRRFHLKLVQLLTGSPFL